MSLFNKAKQLADKHGDKIAKGVDKATDLVDKKTKGKYHDKLDKVDKAVDRAMARDETTDDLDRPANPPDEPTP